MIPRLILHNAISIDGRIDGFTPDIRLFYELTSIWKEDATLAGADTISAAFSTGGMADNDFAPDEPPRAVRGDKRPLLIIPDSRGRIRTWNHLRQAGYWRGMVALCSKTTPESYLDYLRQRYVDYIIAGDDRIDFKEALRKIHSRYKVKTIRVDSGGTLNGVLLRGSLVDEVSILIHPALVGGVEPRSIFRAPELESSIGIIRLKLINSRILKKNIVWMRYKILPLKTAKARRK